MLPNWLLQPKTCRGIDIESMISIRPSRTDDSHRAIEIWRQAVDATHHFLTQDDRVAIDTMVRDFLPQVSLWLAVDANDYPLAFMFIERGHMEALFVDPVYSGLGIGSMLVKYAVSMHPEMTTDVNEQNLQALGFYEKLGFRRTGRSALDGQGRPYPVIHLRYAKD